MLSITRLAGTDCGAAAGAGAGAIVRGGALGTSGVAGAGAVAVAAGVDAGTTAAFDAPDFGSMRIMLRALRTTYSDGLARLTCTRASARPSAPDACSSRTPAIAPWRSTSARASDTLTFRMSTTSERASGRLTE